MKAIKGHRFFRPVDQWTSLFLFKEVGKEADKENEMKRSRIG